MTNILHITYLNELNNLQLNTLINSNTLTIIFVNDYYCINIGMKRNYIFDLMTQMSSNFVLVDDTIRSFKGWQCDNPDDFDPFTMNFINGLLYINFLGNESGTCKSNK